MASLLFNDAKIFIAGHDFSGQMSATALEYGADMLDETTFGATTRINRGGIKSVVGNHQGLWDSSSTTAVDPVLFARVGTSDVPVVVGPEGGAVNALAYLLQAIHAEYTVGGEQNGLLPFSVSFEGSGGQPTVRGRIMYNASASTDVTGTAIQLGAVSASQFVYGALHVFSGSSDIIVSVQSASDQAFTTPNTRITFTTVAAATAVASEWKRTAGSVSDTWWRIRATNIVAARNFAVAVGIQ